MIGRTPTGIDMGAFVKQELYYVEVAVLRNYPEAGFSVHFTHVGEEVEVVDGGVVLHHGRASPSGEGQGRCMQVPDIDARTDMPGFQNNFAGFGTKNTQLCSLHENSMSVVYINKMGQTGEGIEKEEDIGKEERRHLDEITYLGLYWDFVRRRVSLPEKKRLKHLARVRAVIATFHSSNKFSLRDLQEIHECNLLIGAHPPLLQLGFLSLDIISSR
ncbi:hypothetical protein B0H14DRAFT_2584659 [Mycena olivaceomarginata]|nr:hypothetical protein B0H14DRAFT_2584659 [Mycena olivaceomarginata]